MDKRKYLSTYQVPGGRAWDHLEGVEEGFPTLQQSRETVKKQLKYGENKMMAESDSDGNDKRAVS
ncbi:hypothetical protein ARMSODRAFT_958302 [Armillaria solidipes]|uniref:Uncharacterized protein n=1 Tax=Armillaria solidipes TaxID=1076256 RepID=A0A2H3BYP8_9AGAR|nr:hypothetical protein ARMSODRAFT_958302 [Armillaria solidipes]